MGIYKSAKPRLICPAPKVIPSDKDYNRKRDKLIPIYEKENEMKLVNCTPHTINEAITGAIFLTSGNIARVSSENVLVDVIDDIPFYDVCYGNIEGLPEQAEDTIYIVSGLVLNALDGKRTDCVAPGELVRNEQGQPVGCNGFRYH